MPTPAGPTSHRREDTEAKPLWRGEGCIEKCTAVGGAVACLWERELSSQSPILRLWGCTWLEHVQQVLWMYA